MKNKYNSPEIEIILIEDDVITASKMFGDSEAGDDPYSFESFGFE